MDKTTTMMNEVIEVLATLPEECKVYITGPHPKWLRELEHSFKLAGLVDVVFISVDSIREGKLRGARGALLIDDNQDLTYTERDMLESEQRILSYSVPRR